MRINIRAKALEYANHSVQFRYLDEWIFRIKIFYQEVVFGMEFP